MAVNHKPMKTQHGAALVEFAITFLIYLMLIFAIIEFALVIFNATRLSEGTRVGARYAIVNNPACDIFDKGSGVACPGGPLVCPDGNVEVTVDSCAIPASSPECQMVEEMDRLMLRYSSDAASYANRTILAGPGKVVIAYSCSGVGDSLLPTSVPLITISAEDIQHNMMLFGTTITLPSFSTSRTGEDLFNR